MLTINKAKIDKANIAAVEPMLRPYIRRTPVVEVDAGELGLGSFRIFLKLEFLQHSGSFKARGAFANLLLRQAPAAGVAAASGGNHGAAVAYAASTLGIPARIFVPAIASPSKIERIRSYGAELVVGGERYADALAASEQWIAESGALAIHAYDQLETLLGQGTVAAEFEQQCPDIDTVLVAVGGGGLLGGVAGWYGGRTKVVGVEPELAPTLTYALRAGGPVDAPAGGIAADSLAPKRIGQLMFPIAQRHVMEIVLVTDEEIGEAQQMLWRYLRIVVEPGGAAAMAALQSGKYRSSPSERVGVVLCGANTSFLCT